MSEKLKKAGLTPRMLLFSIVWCVVNNIVFGALAIGSSTSVMIPLAFMLMAEAFITRAISPKYQFTPQEWAVFFSVAMSGLLCSPHYGVGDLWHLGTNIAFLRGFLRTYAVAFETWHTFEAPVSGLWIVKDPVAVDAYLYSGPIPWSLFAPVIGFWILNWISLFLAFHFLAIIFRKQWIDVERLPFPWQRPLYETLKSAKAMEGRPSLWNIGKNIWYWIGFLIGAVSAIIDVASIWFGFSPPFMTAALYYAFDLNPYFFDVFPSGLWWWSWTSWGIAFAILAPMDVLNSILFFWILGPGIGMWLNWITGTTPAGDDWTNGAETGIFKWRIMLGGRSSSIFAPVFIALPLILIWRARKTIIRSFKAAISGAPREEDEPHSWRTVWIGFIVCFLVWYASMIAAGASWHVFWSFLMLTLNFILQARLMAETGGIRFNTHFLDQQFNMYYDMLPLYATGEFGNNVTSLTAVMYSTEWYHWWAPLLPMGPSLVGFKFGYETKTRARDISIAMIIATVIGIVIAVVVGIWMFYYWGASVLYTRIIELGGIAVTYEDWPPLIDHLNSGESFFEYYGLPSDFWGWWIAGFILVVIIEFLRRRFAWFFLNSMGIILGAGWVYDFYMGSVLIAWVIKQLSFRVLGGKGYERIVVPAACGVAIGFAVFFMLLQVPVVILGLAVTAL